MPRYQIQSLDDPRLAPFRDLKRSNATRWSDLFVAEGVKLVDRLIDQQLDIVSLLLGERYADAYAAKVLASVDVFVVPDNWIAGIIGFNFHRGVLAAARRRPPVSLADLAATTGPLRLVICHDVQNPENLGSILRLAAAFGVDGLLLGSECCDPYSRRVLRVSMGATFKTRLAHAGDVVQAITSLQTDHNVEVWATTLDVDAERLGQTAPAERLALVLGSEGHGLAPEVVQACRRKITIPMSPSVDSLNVAVAAGIFLYETMRENR